jgi:DNA-binding Lrp family transcriptional regulator
MAILDNTDIQILTEVLRDSRQSYREIARRIGVSPGTVVSRVRDMEEKKIISKYTAQVDFEKMGYDLTVVTEVTVSNGMAFEVGHEITMMRQSCAIYNITGDSDVMVIAKFRNREALSNFTKSLLKIPNVERTKTHLVLNTLKEDFNIL